MKKAFPPRIVKSIENTLPTFYLNSGAIKLKSVTIPNGLLLLIRSLSHKNPPFLYQKGNQSGRYKVEHQQDFVIHFRHLDVG